MQTTTPGATKRATVSTCPSVWSLMRPSPSQRTFSAPRASRSRRSSAPCASPGLRFGLRRHWRVVRSVPSPSGSTEPPSRTSSSRNVRRPEAAATRIETSASPGRSYFPPQPLKANEAAATSPEGDVTKTGAMSRIQMSPNGISWTRASRPASRSRASAARAGVGARTSSRSPRGAPSGPGSAMARANATNASCTGASASFQSSSWLGQASQHAACGAHSAGWENPASRGVRLTLIVGTSRRGGPGGSRNPRETTAARAASGCGLPPPRRRRRPRRGCRRTA